MNYSFRRIGNYLYVQCRGSLDSLELNEDFWRLFHTQLESFVGRTGDETCIDLREIDFVDSRSAFYLLETAQLLRGKSAVMFVGPGPGLKRLNEIGDAPHLSPLFTEVPWQGVDDDAALAPVTGSEEPTILLDGESLVTVISATPGPGPPAEIPPTEDLEEISEVGSASEFVVDLDVEKVYLESLSDTRDSFAPAGGIEFMKQWTQLEPSERGPEAFEDADATIRGPDVDPVQLLLAGARDQNIPLTPTATAPVDPSSPGEVADPSPPPPAGADSPPSHGSETSLAIWEGTGEGGAEDPMLCGMTKLVAELGILERDRRTLRRRLQELERTETAQRQRIVTLEEELHEAMASLEEARGQESEGTNDPLGSWLRGLELRAPEAHALRDEWLGLLRTFSTRARVTPNEIETLAHSFNDVAPGFAASIARWLDTDGDRFGAQPWRAFLLVLSTLVREETAPEVRFAAIRILILTAVVEHTPGRTPQEAEVREMLKRLLDAPAYRFCRGPLNEASLNELLRLWRAARVLASERQLTGAAWRGAVGRALSAVGATDPTRQGIARIVDVHSLYLPGAWVELATGGIGPVIVAQPGQPERPRVLVLFRREGNVCSAVSPRLYPAEGETMASVLRVVDRPVLYTDGEKSLGAPPPSQPIQTLAGFISEEGVTS